MAKPSNHTIYGDENELLNKVSAGNWNAFKLLYDHYIPFVLHYLNVYLTEKQDVEEIAQDVFLKMWKKKELLPGVRSFKNYLFIATRNALNDFLRSRQARLSQQEKYERNFVQPSNYQADEKLVTDQYEEIARTALSTLSEKQQRIFRLRTTEEKTIQEIANEMGMSVGGVHKSLQQAAATLKEYLGKHGVSFSLLLLLLFFE